MCAQLQGALLSNAQLQGASLNGAQLQGGSLEYAQLQGASLTGAQLQGASLTGAQLQGASFLNAQLQGASLWDAQLQGASLEDAQLQGASLTGAQLQGASLRGTQLQGASLQAAYLQAIDLSHAWLWRTNADGPSGAPETARIPLRGASWAPSWKDLGGDPHAWNDKAYHDLRESIGSAPAGPIRDQALYSIGRLDCASPDRALASCSLDPADSPPPEAAAWRQTVEAARVGDEAYAEALVKTLKELVCSGGDDAIYVVRGRGFQTRLGDAGAEASGLIDDLVNKDSKDCPVSATLTDADRAKLLQMKQRTEKAGK
jgi:hypothetical protein